MTVENAVGEIADPVPQANHPAVFGDTDVIGDMTVPEYKVLDVGVLIMFLFCKEDLVFLIHSHKSAQCAMLHAALSGPAVGKCHGSIGMDAGIKPLDGSVLE